MTNYKMVLSYDGSRYRGWQVQGNTDMTIQGKLQTVLSRMTGEEIEVHGSGRTDAGVHAVGQVANFKAKARLEVREIRDYLNEYLPEDIAVQSVEIASGQFHSRLNACEKTYRYRIWTDAVPAVFERKYVTELAEPLRIDDMKEAAEYLIGTHDFISFCGNRRFKKSPVRTITDIRFTKKERELVIDVTGNGFLQNMVRVLVGTLVEVGLGRKRPEEMQHILEGKNRDFAGPAMPAKGLCLMEVRYDARVPNGLPTGSYYPEEE